MNRWVPLAGALFIVAVATCLGLWQQYTRFLETPLDIRNEAYVVNVERGTSLRSLLAKLEQRGITETGWRWRLLTRLQPVVIKTGEYAISPGTLPSQFLKQLDSGKVVNYRFTIVEGWTAKQLLLALKNDPVLIHTIKTLQELEGLTGMPPGNPEGWFLPETYVFVRGDTDIQILRRAYSDMREALEKAWTGRDSNLPYETPYELLIMASIIEKETSMASERANIAGVFVRRLRQRWRLETDPTVIYGMGESYKGNIRRVDLKRDTAYNTYTRHGLPPTPIALAGEASLQAAAHPAAGDAMFFVADGQGGHTFSSTLEEHNKAVRKLIRRTKTNVAKQDKKG